MAQVSGRSLSVGGLLVGMVGCGFPGAAYGHAERSAALRSGITLTSHAVAARPASPTARVSVPAHPGGRIRLLSSERIRPPRVEWTYPGHRRLSLARPAAHGGRKWVLRVPQGVTPVRAVVRGRLEARRFKYVLDLREHEHRPVRTAPGCMIDGVEVLHLNWVFRPRSLRELMSSAPKDSSRPAAKAAVVAQVVAVRRGPPLRDDHAGHEIKTQRIDFRVSSVWSGRIGRRFVLFKTGAADLWAPGDPLYVPGERYVLVVDRGPGRTYIPVAPDARLAIRERTLWPVIAGRVGRILSGLTTREARNALSGARRHARQARLPHLLPHGVF